MVAAGHRRLRASSPSKFGVDLSWLLPWGGHLGRGHIQIVRREVRLELLEKHQAQGHFVLLGQLLNRCLLQLLDIQVQVLVRLQNVRCRVDDVVEELGEEESCSLVLLFGVIKLVLQVFRMSYLII